MKAEIHWNKQFKKWTIHTYKGCSWADYIRVRGAWRTEVKPTRKTNPKGWVVADTSQVEVLDHAEATGNQLMYDKNQMSFSVSAGEDIVFTPQGAFHHMRGGECGEQITIA